MLLPRNLLQAAEADITRSGRNHGHRGGMYEHYAFHRAHVRKGDCLLLDSRRMNVYPV